MNIAIKECVPVYIAMYLWADLFQDPQVVFHVDNISVMYSLLNQTCLVPDIMDMIRKMVLLAMQRNIQFTSMHVSGRLNRQADMISRLQITRALAMFPNLDRHPHRFPTSWLPWSPQQ